MDQTVTTILLRTKILSNFLFYNWQTGFAERLVPRLQLIVAPHIAVVVLVIIMVLAASMAGLLLPRI